MASNDMTALILQMIKQMQEQQHVAQEMMREQQRAADEHQRQFMAAIRREELTRPPPLPDLRPRKVPSDQDRLQGVLQGTRGLSNVVQGPPYSTIGAWVTDALLTETAGATKQR